MANMTNLDRLIINELLDHGVFTTTPLAAATQQSRAAIAELKKPSVQQRIGNYFKICSVLHRTIFRRTYCCWRAPLS